MSIILLFQTHLNFAREFTQAVEMKQVAQQEAERARYLVEKVSKLVNKTDITAGG
jgi:prohibitin 1